MAARRDDDRERPEADDRRPTASAEDLAPSSGRSDLATLLRDLPPSDSTDHLPALTERVKTDLHRRWQQGRPVTLESYLEAFPELGSRDTVAADLVLAEYEARCRSGAPADLAGFEERFPHHAEALRRLVMPGEPGGPTTNSLLDQLGAVAAEPRGAPPGAPPSVTLDVKVATDLPEHFGRYRVLKRLGRGAMGTVYLADDTQLGRQVALKVPHFRTAGKSRAPSPHDLDRFYREARAAATLDHPNLCPVYEIGQVEGIPYLTMAYIRGRPLSKSIDPDRPIPPRRAAVVVRKLAKAMEEAHRHGVVHRDLKPSNIMVGSRRELVIMDFGLAWRVGAEDKRLTRRGLIVGTPAYMSPEQLSGRVEDLGPRCDIYSLGVIMYELLTARRPFDGPDTVILGQILYVDPVSPSAHRPDLDDRISAVCLKAMAKRPEDRYATMEELASALTDYLRRSTHTSRSPEPVAAPGLHRWADDDPRHSGTPTAIPSRPAEANSAGELAGSATTDQPNPAATFWEVWDRWVALVETIVLRPEKRRQLSRALYERSYKELIAACRAKAATASRQERDFYWKLEAFVLPWLTPKAIVQTDRDLLFSLLDQLQELTEEIEGRPRVPDDLGVLASARSAWVWGAATLLVVTIVSIWLVWM
jgi:serine/threonine protein kinase